MKAFGLLFLIMVAVFSASRAFAQGPASSSDCWKCSTKFCFDEVFGYPCPDQQCTFVWIPDPNNPNNGQIRKFSCKTGDLEHDTEVVDSQMTFEDCKQEGAGYIRTGHTTPQIVCSVIHECGCDAQNQCVQGAKLRDEDTRDDHKFTSTGLLTVCVYVEAVPGPNN